MKGILIDANNRTIREIDVPNDKVLDTMYKYINCDLVDVVRIDETNDLWVDDEGLLKLTDESKFFSFQGYPSPMVGNGIILGHDGMGESISPTITIDEIRNKIKFYNMEEIVAMGRWD